MSGVGARAAALVLLATAVAGCSAAAYAPASPPRASDARALVDRVIDLALARRFDELCGLGTAQCGLVLTETGTGAAPTERPVIVSVTTVPNVETTPGSWTPGGVMFLLCGLDGKGAPYHSEMLVAENPAGGGLVAMEPVFWGGFTVGSPVAQPKPSETGDVWASCPG